MPHVVGAGAERSASPEVDEIEAQRVLDRDRRLQAKRRLPSAEAHADHLLADRARLPQREAHTVDADDVTAVVAGLYFEAGGVRYLQGGAYGPWNVQKVDADGVWLAHREGGNTLRVQFEPAGAGGS